MQAREEAAVIAICEKRMLSRLGCVRAAGNYWSQTVLQYASRGHFNEGGTTKDFAGFLENYIVKPSIEMLRHQAAQGDLDPTQMGHMQAAVMATALQATTFGLFAASGFPVYEITEAEVLEMEERRLGDRIALESALPHKCFFVAWPTSERLSFFWGEKGDDSSDGQHREYMDGVFVSENGADGLRLLFTKRLGDGTALMAAGPTTSIDKLSGVSLREAVASAPDAAEAFGSKVTQMNVANQALRDAIEEAAAEAETMARAASDRIAGAIAYVQRHATTIEAPDQEEEMPITGYGQKHKARSHFEAMAMALEQGALPVKRIETNTAWLEALPEITPHEQTPEEKKKLVRIALGTSERVAGRIEYAEDEVTPEECVEPAERDVLEEVLTGDAEMVQILLTELKKSSKQVPFFVTTLNAMGEQVADRFRQRLADLSGGKDGATTRWQECVQESVSALNRHVADMADPYQIVGIMSSHPEGPEHRCKLTIMCKRSPDPMTPSFVWDHVECTYSDPLTLLLLASDGLDVCALGTEHPTRERQLHPLFRYHPERYRSTRMYADEAGQQLDRFAEAAAAGKVPRERVEDGYLATMNGAIGLMISELNSENMRKPMRQRSEHGAESMTQTVNAEMNLFAIISNWRRFGRQIFDFPRRMMDMFAMTDIDEIPCDKVKLPHHIQYVHFGPREDIEIDHGWLVDGAYIEALNGGGWQICITSVPRNPEDAYGWTSRPEPIFVQRFGEREMAMTLGEAVDYALADKLAELRDKAAMGDGEITEELKASFEEQDLQLPEGLKIVKVFARSAASETETLMRRLPAYKKALRLVVNAMCYVTAYPDDVKEEFPPEAPGRLLKTAATRVGSKDQKKALSKLEQLGFRAIHFCGQALMGKMGLGGLGTQHGAGWTRGHWRNQAWGPKHSLRRLQWIMPFRTGVDKGDPEMGHLYMVT